MHDEKCFAFQGVPGICVDLALDPVAASPGPGAPGPCSAAPGAGFGDMLRLPRCWSKEPLDGAGDRQFHRGGTGANSLSFGCFPTKLGREKPWNRPRPVPSSLDLHRFPALETISKAISWDSKVLAVFFPRPGVPGRPQIDTARELPDPARHLTDPAREFPGRVRVFIGRPEDPSYGGAGPTSERIGRST